MTARRPLRLLGATLAAAALAAMPAQAQTSVDVTLDNGVAGTRVLFVEDVVGNPLTSLDFGSARSLPFLVRVEDTTMGRDGFTVNATMTNLYRDSGGSLDFESKIGSDSVAVSNPLNSLGVVDVSARVQPVVDTVTTISDPVVCLALALGTSPCQLSLSGLMGEVQDVTSVVDLGDLSNLPLLPQAAETGAFTNPDYQGAAAGDPGKPGAFTPTSKRMLAGSPVATPAVLTSLKTALDAIVAGLPSEQVVQDDTLVAGAVGLLGALTAEQVSAIVNSPTAVTVQNLDAGQILAQTGKYSATPMLDVTVPDGAPAGSFKGTLVVTAIQP
jgi:hypothetical protein